MAKDNKRQELYISNLSQMIQKETVSEFDQPDLSKFREFQDLLRMVHVAIRLQQEQRHDDS